MRYGKDLRTQLCNVRIADQSWVDGLPAFQVKAGGTRRDVYTLKEMLADFYGEGCKCIIIQQDGEIVLI